jgi:hypothetical protein
MRGMSLETAVTVVESKIRGDVKSLQNKIAAEYGAVDQVNEISGKNKENITTLADAVSRFKVEA